MIARHVPLLLGLLLPFAPAAAREAVSASPPGKVAVAVYRDPQRDSDEAMDLEWLNGYALISETRTVTLPAGPATARFEGVAEGMVAVTALVDGLPGGVGEQNRDARLLSPAALIDGTLGNRVTVRRTNPATGAESEDSAIVRTRADGGLVLQSREGFEAVRCAGLPEKLLFDGVPDGLSPQPVFSVNTNSQTGGTYRVTLTYLASGFDWQAHYVATLRDGNAAGAARLALTGWLTIGNQNQQSFADAQLVTIAGKLNIASDYRELGTSPDAPPLRLTCYPIGSTAAGSSNALDEFDGYGAASGGNLGVVALQRRSGEAVYESMDSAIIVTSMKAREENLGDLKLYRVPEPVTVSANGQKQIAFVDRPAVEGVIIHRAVCGLGDDRDTPQPLAMRLRTKNIERNGLGVALPQGKVTLFEPVAGELLLLGEESIRDHAVGQDVEITLAKSSAVFGHCTVEVNDAKPERSQDDQTMMLVLTNANARPVDVEIAVGTAGEEKITPDQGRVILRDGEQRLALKLPANSRRTIRWRAREVE